MYSEWRNSSEVLVIESLSFYYVIGVSGVVGCDIYSITHYDSPGVNNYVCSFLSFLGERLYFKVLEGNWKGEEFTCLKYNIDKGEIVVRYSL